jgi:hypothetical protein
LDNHHRVFFGLGDHAAGTGWKASPIPGWRWLMVSAVSVAGVVGRRRWIESWRYRLLTINY